MRNLVRQVVSSALSGRSKSPGVAAKTGGDRLSPAIVDTSRYRMVMPAENIVCGSADREAAAPAADPILSPRLRCCARNSGPMDRKTRPGGSKVEGSAEQPALGVSVSRANSNFEGKDPCRGHGHRERRRELRAQTGIIRPDLPADRTRRPRRLAIHPTG